MSLLGFYTKKEVENIKTQAYYRGYVDGYENSYLENEVDIVTLCNKNKALENKNNSLETENKKLKQDARKERHEEVSQIRYILKNTNKFRVKKKCEARLLKIRLNR